MPDIEEPRVHRIALHHLAFRPFFLLSTVFAVSAMLWWWWIRHYPDMWLQTGLTSITWHAHEMLYGYGMAVIVGFVLTAARNWTGIQTLHGIPLLLLASLWLGARVAVCFAGHTALLMAAVLDLGFMVLASSAIAYPLLKVKQWHQFGVIAIVLAMLAGNAMFYYGVLAKVPQLVTQGIYAGLHVVIALIMFMGRRVIPFFIETGVGHPLKLRNRRWVDRGTLMLLGLYLPVEIFQIQATVAANIATMLLALQVVRLFDWYTPAILKKPLLWSLYLAYGWIAIGFALKALSLLIPLSPMLAVHAFAVGGIGLMTLSMMSRVSLGHTGRSVFDSPAGLQWAFVLLLASAVVRVVLPLLLPDHYGFWIGLAQWLWIAAFTMFAFLYVPMLVKPRIDGRYG